MNIEIKEYDNERYREGIEELAARARGTAEDSYACGQGYADSYKGLPDGRP